MAREQKAKKAYTVGEESQRSANKDATALVFTFAHGEVVSVNLGEFNEDIRVCAAWHGLAQKIGDAYASADSSEDAYEKAMSTVELLQAGRWVGERESAGPRISMLAQAIYNAKVNAGAEADMGAISANLVKNEEKRKNALNNPVINAEFEALKAQRAVERATKAKEKAAVGGEDSGDLGDF